MFILLIACVIITFLFILGIIYIISKKTMSKSEHYQSDLDPNLLEIDGLEYITKELKWEIDYNISDYLPTLPADPRYIAVERNEIINARKSVLKDFQAMRRRFYSGVNISYQYVQACILRSDRVLDYLSRDNACNLKGKILSYDKDTRSPDAKYGKRKTIDMIIDTFSFDKYIKSKSYNIDTLTLQALKKDIYPSDGCIIETMGMNEKNIFFDKITKLAFMKRYAKEFDANNKMVETLKLMEKNKSYDATMNLYGIVENKNYDTTLLPAKCTIRSTQPVNNPHNKYNVLKDQIIKCNDDEALSSVKLKNEAGKVSYIYTCCKPQMQDNRIVMKADHETKYTKCRESDDNYQKTWELSNDIKCDSYLHEFSLNIADRSDRSNSTCSDPQKTTPVQNNPSTNDYYKYRCSTFGKRDKDPKKDLRVVDKSCSRPIQTASISKISGIENMTSLVMDCDSDFIQNVKKIDTDGGRKYAYEYTCCRPTVNFPQ